MNGVHDLGGFQNFGPVQPEPDEPVFHADWERRAFALTLAMATPGGWNIDMSRHARESLPPAQYLSSSYYEIWLAGMERLMMARGLVTREEIETGRALVPPVAIPQVLTADMVETVLARGGPADRAPAGPARFAPGDAVRARNLHPAGHTRLPRYARGRTGTVARVQGCHVFPDSNAHGRGEAPQWLYSVRFAARELWGEAAAAGDSVHIDLWESYLEPA
ncbi:nitrile hydratase [Tepidamorphus gemmatus]|jgi:nitrile hydratase beta subunit|uniref:Nitrile hydratase subunit beta n=1 Tax=Tepidamorphus gemmatus TaxID=747076 RepID=A0A4R3MML9_9HYPH|nr:nitrile hydratase subunit beta [Tepidamorphus gemmatus]TCT13236.1 nitrile hydratase [Tepidamorphus gemmatus]